MRSHTLTHPHNKKGLVDCVRENHTQKDDYKKNHIT
jgi:hypothetical protein